MSFDVFASRVVLGKNYCAVDASKGQKEKYTCRMFYGNRHKFLVIFEVTSENIFRTE